MDYSIPTTHATRRPHRYLISSHLSPVEQPTAHSAEPRFAGFRQRMHLRGFAPSKSTRIPAPRHSTAQHSTAQQSSHTIQHNTETQTQTQREQEARKDDDVYERDTLSKGDESQLRWELVSIVVIKNQIAIRKGDFARNTTLCASAPQDPFQHPPSRPLLSAAFLARLEINMHGSSLVFQDKPFRLEQRKTTPG